MAHHDHTRFLTLLHTFISPAAITLLARCHGWLAGDLDQIDARYY